MRAQSLGQIDLELKELHLRHRAACEEITRLLIQVAGMEFRADVLLDRRLVLVAEVAPEPQH